MDPGPSYVFRAPIIPSPPDGPRPPMFELGLECEFLRAHSARRTSTVVSGKTYDSLIADVDGWIITLLSDEGLERPRRVKVERGGKTLIEMEYLEYRRDLPPRMELFAPPAGVKITQQD